MIGPGEALRWIALAAEEIRLPWAVGGDAGNLVDLGLVGDRIGGVGRGGGDDEVDLVAEDQLGGHLGGAAAARLAVLGDDLHRIAPSADAQAGGEQAAHLIEDEAVGLAEAGERAGLRADVPDLDGARLGTGRDHAQHRRRGKGAEPGLHHGTAAHVA